MKKILGTLSAVAFAVSASTSFAACDAGEKVVKLSHVTGGTTHPKVVAANNTKSQSCICRPFSCHKIPLYSAGLKNSFAYVLNAVDQPSLFLFIQINSFQVEWVSRLWHCVFV